jgi:predicted enzyme related to lactoylglutathione lyase
MLKAVNAILISTHRAGLLIEFYKKLGVPLEIHDHGGGKHAEADFGEVHFAIWERNNAKVVESNNVCFSFHVPELEDFYQQKLKEGIVFDHPPQALPFGGVITATKDPDGNRITFMRWDSDKK